MWTLLLGLAIAAEPVPSDAPPLDAVVHVVQGAGSCAGALIDPAGTVVTAYHCVASGGRPKLWTRDGRAVIGRVVRIDVAGDLALIDAPELAGGAWLPLAPAPPALGETVRALGHPQGARLPVGYVEGLLRWSIAEGVVSAVGPRALQTTAPLNPGNSGGPLVDEAGALVGVISRRYPGQGLGFATRVEAVQAMLDGEGRRFGPLGGTLAAEVFLASYQAGIGSLSLGGRLEVAFRERVFLGVALAVPLDARWTVTRFDAPVHWSQAEARLGLRQRIGRGPWSGRVDAYGGVASVRTLRPSERYGFEGVGEAAPLVGGAFSVRGITLDAAALWTAERVDLRLSVVVRFPGTLWMF